jgi:tetratricopeptide (TPR) repeat protein
MAKNQSINQELAQLEEELQALNADPACDPRRQLDVLNQLAWAIRHFDPQRALLLSQAAYTLVQQQDYPAGRLACLLNLAVLNTLIAPHYEVAFPLMNEALDLLESHPNATIHTYLFLCLASVYRLLGDYPTTQSYLLQALTLSRQATDPALEGFVNNDLGVLYRYTHQYEQGLKAYQQALVIAQATGNQQRVALALNNMGDLLNLCGRTEEALPCLEEALALTRQLGIKILEPSVLDSLSELCIQQAKYAEALAYLQQAQQMVTAFNNQAELATFLRNIARVYQKLGDWPLALEYLRQALAVAEEIKLLPEIYTCHQLLAEIYEQQGEPAKALGHYKQFHAVKEELYNEQADQKLKTLQVIHETATAKREAEIYRLKNVELQAALDQVKQLSGLLPICSGCKKIRDDGGYWQDVAVYIRDHSEAEFSHGICPDCRERLYPRTRTLTKGMVNNDPNPIAPLNSLL